MHDVKSERKAVDAARLERLTAVLQSVSELCHKINNPLTALLGRAQMLGLRAKDDPYVKNACAVIEESSRRIAETVEELAEVVHEARRDSPEA